MASKKQNKQSMRKVGTSIFKKLLIILLVLGMIGMYIIMPLMGA